MKDLVPLSSPTAAPYANSGERARRPFVMLTPAHAARAVTGSALADARKLTAFASFTTRGPRLGRTLRRMARSASLVFRVRVAAPMASAPSAAAPPISARLERRGPVSEAFTLHR